MKKGCFLTGITLFTIIIAVGLFLYRKYWPELKEASKEKIFNIALNEVDEKIDNLEKSIYKDSLKLFLRKSIRYYKAQNFENAMNKFGDVLDQTRFFINDGKIDSVEFTALKNMVKGYERPTEVGN
ncbi:MAG: hypothetical protein RDU14_03865 [Melioribacteraceae bacterium]|nr:hypothetical protein [Melioribacteraceae bacterium]